MTFFRPKYITFDCYGTLTRFRMTEMVQDLFPDRLTAEQIVPFCRDFSAYRYDEVLGDWKPYTEVIENALARTCKKWDVEYRDEGKAIYEAVPTWGPHDDVPAGLSKTAEKIPLVILSNAMDAQIPSNVALLGAPFHKVLTAQQAQAYKPRLRAFEYMLDTLGCDPKDIMHVSSSFRYDQCSATDMGIGTRVFVGRGHEPSNAFYRDVEIPHIGCLPALIGL